MSISVLTDKRISSKQKGASGKSLRLRGLVARAVEAKMKEKNT